MHDVAQTILAQLGGRRFLAMTGASHLFADGDALIFTLPRTRHFVAKGINKVRIALTPADTYTVEFYRLTKHDCALLASAEDLYAEDLQAYFTRETGLNTHL